MRISLVLLWTAATALLMTNGIILLFACDLDVPSALSVHRKFCPVPPDHSPLARERAQKDNLEARIHEAELKLARVPRCAETDSTTTPQQRTERLNGPQVGARGRLEITLWWRTKDDLDLNVLCPGGRISPVNSQTTGPGICGDGLHDVEANRNLINPVNDPAEHIVWQRGIPEGLYKVLVVPKSTLGPNPIDYEVRVDLDGESRVCSGQVQWDAEGGTGNAQFPLAFNATHPLPACQSVNVNMRKCSPDEPNCRKS
jgi:hypothetical protein